MARAADLEAAPVPLAGGLYFDERRRFLRKSATIAFAILALAPLIYYKDTHELTVLLTRVYLVLLVLIHVVALGVFVYRVPWRALFAHPIGFITRVVGLVVFGGLLAMIEFDAHSPWFWGALTLLWFYHVAALALLHIRHRHEAVAARTHAGCPVGPFSPPTPGDPAEPK